MIIKDRTWGVRTLMELGEGLDYAEGFDVSDKSEIAGGTVLVIDSKNPGKLAISDKPYDSRVAEDLINIGLAPAGFDLFPALWQPDTFCLI